MLANPWAKWWVSSSFMCRCLCANPDKNPTCRAGAKRLRIRRRIAGEQNSVVMLELQREALELPTGIEPVTSSLPWKCSTN